MMPLLAGGQVAAGQARPAFFSRADTVYEPATGAKSPPVAFIFLL